jgi:hypothetical protein
MFIDTKTLPRYPLTIPCKGCSTLGQLIATGKYDWVSPDINDEHFLLTQKGTMRTFAHPVDLGRGRMVRNSDAKIELAKSGLHPANIEQLLAFGAAYPNEQRKYPIIALESVSQIHGHQCVAFLAADRGSRIAGILAWDDDWSTAMRFLVVYGQHLRKS